MLPAENIDGPIDLSVMAHPVEMKVGFFSSATHSSKGIWVSMAEEIL
jgi:hypothetical protein